MDWHTVTPDEVLKETGAEFLARAQRRFYAEAQGGEVDDDSSTGADRAASQRAVKRDPAPPSFSDDALALTFAERHAGELRYVAQWGQWLAWTRTHWRPDTTLHAFDLARAIAREIASTCKQKRTAIPLTSAKTVAAVERLAKADRRLAATDDQWDGRPTAFNTPTIGG